MDFEALWAVANLFENSLLDAAISCDGEPAPDRVLPDMMPVGLIPPGSPNGDLPDDARGSIGELLAEGEFERFGLAECEE